MAFLDLHARAGAHVAGAEAHGDAVLALDREERLLHAVAEGDLRRGDLAVELGEVRREDALDRGVVGALGEALEAAARDRAVGHAAEREVARVAVEQRDEAGGHRAPARAARGQERAVDVDEDDHGPRQRTRGERGLQASAPAAAARRSMRLNRSARRHATRVAIAMIGTCELTPMLVGKIEPSPTKRPGKSKHSPL